MRTANGVIELDVINELVSPGASSDISVNVYVSMIDDAKFAQPDGEKIADLSYFRHPDEGSNDQVRTPFAKSEMELQKTLSPKLEKLKLEETTLDSQSGIIEQDGVDEPMAATQLETIAGEAAVADQTMNVFFGESPTSIRELIKRYVMVRYWFVAYNLSEGGSSIVRLSNKVFPYQRGYDNEGIDGYTFGPYNFANMNPISWFQACYAGYRGAIRHKYLYHGGANMINPVVQRQSFSPNTSGVWNVIPLLEQETNTPVLTRDWTNTTWQGATGTGLAINNAIEAEFPFYNEGRFNYARIIGSQSMDCPSTSSHFCTGLEESAVTTRTKIGFQQWVSAGEDFSYYFFTGVPIMYQYS